jgi:hypothetical protein
MRVLPWLLMVLGMALVASACGGGGMPTAGQEESVPVGRLGPGAIAVAQRDYAFDVQDLRVSAGHVEFRVTNRGSGPHELFVVPRDGGRFGSPVAESDAQDPGASSGLRVKLGPGNYSLVCLLVATPREGPVSHMELGMRLDFEVSS